MARKSKETINQEILREAKDRFEAVQSREGTQRSLAVEDLRFVNEHDGMWDEDARSKRKDRPRLTINRIRPAIDQIIGDQKQNRTSIKVRPASGEADKATAVIYEGTIRNIESQSQAENVYDDGFEEAVTCGYGGWRVNTEFADDDTFDQDIRIRPVKCAATSLFFGFSEHYDKRDADYGFYTAFMDLGAFKAKYPKSQVANWEQREFSYDEKWFRKDEVRVAEYWKKTPVNKTICLLSDGRVIDKEAEKPVLDELLFTGVEVVKERTVKSHKVEMYIVNGAEVLKGPMQWAGKYIPLIPLFGKVAVVEGQEIVYGLTRFAKDVNRAYNYATSANIEAVALSPKDPYWLTSKMVGKNKAQFENFTTKNSPFMIYEPDERVGNQPPQRTGAPQVQQALQGITQQAAMDMYAVTGLEPASMGNSPELKSGKAIEAQQRMGDRGSFVFNDNLSKSIQYTGDILVDLIPKIYDTQRVIRTLGEDGTTEVLKINEKAFDEFNQPLIDEETGKQTIVNDLSRGKYDVEVTTGPAFTTKRRESMEQLLELTAASPEFAEISGDLVAKSMDVIESDELAKRMRKLYIQKGVAEPTEEEIQEMGLDQPQEPDPQAIALIQNLESQTAKNMSDIENDQVEREKKMAEARKTMAEAEAQELENDLIESGVAELIQDGDV